MCHPVALPCANPAGRERRPVLEGFPGDLVDEVDHALALVALQFVTVGAHRANGFQRIARAVVTWSAHAELDRRNFREGMGEHGGASSRGSETT